MGPTAEPWPEEERLALEALTGSPVDPSIFTAEQGDGRERILAGLLEGLGAGRRLLRNTRAVIEGLPEREVLTHKLSLPAEATPALLASLTGEFDEHASPLPAPVLSDDPRLAWLVDYLEKNERDKLVLICSTIARAEAVAEHLGSIGGGLIAGLTAFGAAAGTNYLPQVPEPVYWLAPVVVLSPLFQVASAGYRRGRTSA